MGTWTEKYFQKERRKDSKMKGEDGGSKMITTEERFELAGRRASMDLTRALAEMRKAGQP